MSTAVPPPRPIVPLLAAFASLVVLTTDADAIRHLFTGDPLTRAHGNEAVRPLVGDRVQAAHQQLAP